MTATATATLASREGRGAVPASISPPVVPFGEASSPLIESAADAENFTLQTGAQSGPNKPVAITANGYLAGIWVRVVNKVAGVEEEAKKAETNEEFPENIFARLNFTDQGGAEIHNITGYNFRLADLFGGYMAQPDLHKTQLYKATKLSPAFYIYIPIAILRTGFGALSNMQNTTQYQLQYVLESVEKLYKEKLKTNPEFELSLWAELFPLPPAMTGKEDNFPNGRPQEQVPPLEGTIQKWTEEANKTIKTGEQNFEFKRVGQMVRMRIIRTFTTANVASNEILPPKVRYQRARIGQTVLPSGLLTDWALTKVWGSEPTDIAKGVYPLIYSEGDERSTAGTNPGSWNPTMNTTSEELKGEFKEGLGTIVTNDVAEFDPTETARRESGGYNAQPEPSGAE